jgi:hypothetical protein
MFRFSIRQLMLVTLVAAMGVGWWADHRTSQLAIQTKDSEITKAGRDLNIERLRHTARWGLAIRIPETLFSSWS